jgi:hypothetical protein
MVEWEWERGVRGNGSKEETHFSVNEWGSVSARSHEGLESGFGFWTIIWKALIGVLVKWNGIKRLAVLKRIAWTRKKQISGILLLLDGLKKLSKHVPSS